MKIDKKDRAGLALSTTTLRALDLNTLNVPRGGLQTEPLPWGPTRRGQHDT